MTGAERRSILCTPPPVPDHTASDPLARCSRPRRAPMRPSLPPRQPRRGRPSSPSRLPSSGRTHDGPRASLLVLSHVSISRRSRPATLRPRKLQQPLPRRPVAFAVPRRLAASPPGPPRHPAGQMSPYRGPRRRNGTAETTGPSTSLAERASPRSTGWRTSVGWLLTPRCSAPTSSRSASRDPVARGDNPRLLELGGRVRHQHCPAVGRPLPAHPLCSRSVFASRCLFGRVTPRRDTLSNGVVRPTPPPAPSAVPTPPPIARPSVAQQP